MKKNRSREKVDPVEIANLTETGTKRTRGEKEEEKGLVGDEFGVEAVLRVGVFLSFFFFGGREFSSRAFGFSENQDRARPLWASGLWAPPAGHVGNRS